MTECRIFRIKATLTTFKLEDGETDELLQLLDSSKVQLYVQGGTKSTARCLSSIFGDIIILSEDATKSLPPDQLLAIIAHELGHLYSRDNLVYYAVEAIYSAFKLLLSLLINDKYSIFAQFGFDSEPEVVALWFGELFTSVLRGALNPIELTYWRFTEFRADKFADSLGFGGALSMYLESSNSFKVKSSWIYSIFKRSHPLSSDRIDAIRFQF